MRTLKVPLTDSADKALERYARVRGVKPEEAAAAAIEHYLRESADLALRFVEARRQLGFDRAGHG